MISKLLNLSLMLLKVPQIDNSTKGIIIGFLVLFDALLFAFALGGKSKDGTFADTPLFIFSVLLLIGIIVFAQF